MKIAIAGGGVGGMTAALLLSKDGHEVTIYEQSRQLGGRMAYAQGSGYRIDQGPTIVLLPQMLRSILEEAGLPPAELELLPCEPMYRIHYADGTQFAKYSDTAKQVEELERLFPGEAERFHTYMDTMKERFKLGKRAFLERAFVRQRDFWTISNMLSLAKLRAYRTVRQDAGRFFRSAKLQEAFSFQTLYIGGNPAATPALYSLIPYAEHAFGIWYLKGGYAGLIGKMAGLLAAKGVSVRCGSRVEKLLVADRSCTGLRVNGREEACDKVVWNGDFPALHALLPEGSRYRKGPRYTASSGCLLVYLGLKRIYEDHAVHQFFMSGNLDAMMRDVFGSRQMPDDPSIYVFNPSVMDETLAPPGKSVLYMLIPVPSGAHIDWGAERRLADRMIAEVERRGFTGLSQAIEWKQVRTPGDALEEGLFQGGSFGIAPGLRQSGVFRPQIAPFRISNLYAVGASVHPGGGVPVVMQGAKLLADYLRAEAAAENR